MRLSHMASSLSLGLALLFASAPLAAQAPAGSTGVCTDGSYTSAKAKSGACSRHGGVKEWYAAPAAAAKTSAPAQKAAPAAAAKAGDVTGTCNDGTTTTAKTKAGACSRHGGVKEWSGAAAAAKAAPATETTAPAAGASKVKTAPIAGAPANATALCNDGTYSESQHRSGTCSDHKGVKQWLKDIPAK